MTHKDANTLAMRSTLAAHNTTLGLEPNNGDSVDVFYLLVTLIRFCDDNALDLDAIREDAADFIRSEEPPAIRRKLGISRAAVGG